MTQLLADRTRPRVGSSQLLYPPLTMLTKLKLSSRIYSLSCVSSSRTGRPWWFSARGSRRRNCRLLRARRFIIRLRLPAPSCHPVSIATINGSRCAVV